MHIDYQNRILRNGQSWSGRIDIEVLENFGVCSLVHIRAELYVDDIIPWSATET